jgi:hypothetical protein
MRNYVLPNINFVDKYLKISRSKRDNRRTILAGIELQVLNSFIQYDNSIGLWNITSIAMNGSPESEALLHCYVVRNKAMEVLRGDIFSAQSQYLKNTCQYCQIDTPLTLDHFLEKSQFEEFAAYGKNLIPCCYSCNLGRPQGVIGNNGQQIINFYYDQIPVERFLFCNLTIVDGVPVADYFLQQGNIVHPIFSTIQNHFVNLSLLGRYNSKCTDDLEFIIDKCNGSFTTAEEASYYFIEEGNRLSRVFSLNHWKTALYYGVAYDLSFLNSILR